MKARAAMVAVVVAAAGGLAMAAMRQEDWQPPKPGKQHEFLKQLEGTWVAESEFMNPKPGDPPMKGKSTDTCKLAVNGLFLIMDVEGTMMGKPFLAHGIFGYDTHKSKFTGSWVDSMSTAIWTSEGSLDDSGKVLTCVMEGPDPMTGHPHKMKYVIEITGKDSRKMTFHMEHEGKEMQVGTIDYKRKK